MCLCDFLRLMHMGCNGAYTLIQQWGVRKLINKREEHNLRRPQGRTAREEAADKPRSQASPVVNASRLSYSFTILPHHVCGFLKGLFCIDSHNLLKMLNSDIT